MKTALIVAVTIAVAVAFVNMMREPVETRDCNWSATLKSCAWGPKPVSIRSETRKPVDN